MFDYVTNIISSWFDFFQNNYNFLIIDQYNKTTYNSYDSLFDDDLIDDDILDVDENQYYNENENNISGFIKTEKIQLKINRKTETLKEKKYISS